MDYLRRFVLWFLSGLGLALGIAFVMWGLSKFSSTKPTPDVRIATPATKHRVTDVAPVPITRYVVVSGVLTNDSAQSPEIELKVELHKDSKLLYACDGHETMRPNPGKSMRFQIACRELDTAGVPPGATYQVRATEVRPE